MASVLLLIHSLFRWFVLAAGLYAVARMAIGQSRNGVYTKADRVSALVFVSALDLQFLIGLLLFATSPLIKKAIPDMRAAMADPHVRFFVTEHPVMMVAALGVAHAASVQSKRGATDHEKFKKAGMGFALSLGLILAAIPWFRLKG